MDLVSAPDYIALPAAQGLTRLQNGRGTVHDLIAYRAWITWCRLQGGSEHILSMPIKLANQYARDLGVG